MSNLVSRLPLERFQPGAETWPNTTFPLVFAHYDDQKIIGEGVLVGPQTVLTLTRNLHREGAQPSSVEIGVAWDGINQADTSEVSAWALPSDHQAGEGLGVIRVKKDFSRKYGHLGLGSVPDLAQEQLFAYAFRKGERKSEVVPIGNPRVSGDLISYDLLTNHDPIVGAALVRRRPDGGYDLVGLHVETAEGRHQAQFLTEARITWVSDFMGEDR